jgi:hypothetical protein
MLGRLYVKRLVTPRGNVAHELVAMVAPEAVAAERERRNAAIVGAARARRWERERAEIAESRRKSEALFLAAEQWIADRRERGLLP